MSKLFFTRSLVQISQNATKVQIQEALAQLNASPKPKKGFPNLQNFCGTIEKRDFLKIQKQMRDEW